MELACVCVRRSPFGCLSSASQRECVRPRLPALLCTSAGRISASGRPRLPACPCRCSFGAAARSSLAQASAPPLSACARVASIRPVSESLPLLSCALAGVGRLGVHPRSLPRCQQRLCPRPSSWLWPSRASQPSPLLPFHALPLLPLLQFPAPLVYPFLCVLSATFLSVTLCFGTPCRCMGSVLVLIANCLHHPVAAGYCWGIQLGGTPLALRLALPFQLQGFSA
jgi:hypothetical protein